MKSRCSMCKEEFLVRVEVLDNLPYCRWCHQAMLDLRDHVVRPRTEEEAKLAKAEADDAAAMECMSAEMKSKDEAARGWAEAVMGDLMKEVERMKDEEKQSQEKQVKDVADLGTESSTIGREAVIEAVAELCHQAARRYNQLIGDTELPSWSEAPDWQKKSVKAGVRAFARNPDVTPRSEPRELDAVQGAGGLEVRQGQGCREEAAPGHGTVRQSAHDAEVQGLPLHFHLPRFSFQDP